MALTALLAGTAGAAPEVSIHVGRNGSFVFPDALLEYVVVTSTEHGDTLAGTLDAARSAVTLSYLADGATAPVPEPVDERILLGALRGRTLIAGNDCVVCHFEKSDVAQAIPTYTQIAARYAGNFDAAPALVVKIHHGSQHAWGEIPMPGHPDLSDEDATAIADYILSFANHEQRDFLPVTGSVTVPLSAHLVRDRFGERLPGRFLLTASYAEPDAGDPSAASFGYAQAELRYNNVPATGYDTAEGLQRVEIDSEALVAPTETSGQLVLSDLDLSGIGSITVLGLGSSGEWPGGSVELRLDSPRGLRLGRARLSYDAPETAVGEARIGLPPVEGRHDLYVLLRGKLALARLCFACDP